MSDLPDTKEKTGWTAPKWPRGLKVSGKAKPTPYDLSNPEELQRLYSEVFGYLNTCHNKHGTDWQGRAFAMEALITLVSMQPTPALSASSDMRAALEKGASALLALLDAVRKEPAMAKREYVQLGIQCTDAAKAMSAALSQSPAPAITRDAIDEASYADLRASGGIFADEGPDVMATLEAVMEQAEADMASAHETICKLQGLDPKTHDWPEWSPQANSRRWFAKLRKKFGIADPALKDV